MLNESQEFDVGPSEDLQRANGWYAENWIPPDLDPANVPARLRHLFPLARQWGITCDITRHDAASKATDVQLASLAEKLAGTHSIYEDWAFGGMPEFDSTSEECSIFGAMYLFELEEVNGPGVRSKLDWATTRYENDKSDQNRVVFQQALDKIVSRGRRFIQSRKDSVELAQRLLSESATD